MFILRNQLLNNYVLQTITKNAEYNNTITFVIWNAITEIVNLIDIFYIVVIVLLFIINMNIRMGEYCHGRRHSDFSRLKLIGISISTEINIECILFIGIIFVIRNIEYFTKLQNYTIPT
jgi:hypothetical protein